MRHREFKDRLLVGFYRFASDSDINGFHDPEEAARNAGLKWRPGFLRVASKDLDDQGYISLSETMGGGDDGGMDFRLRGSGIEFAEDLLDENPQYAWPPAELGMPFKYIQIPNQTEIALSADLGTLKAEISKANFTTEDERLATLSEIATFEATIIQPRVSTDLIQRFVNGVLKAILALFGAAAIAEVAERLISALTGLL